MKKVFHIPGGVIHYDQQWPEHGGWFSMTNTPTCWKIQSVRYRPHSTFRISFMDNSELFQFELPSGAGSPMGASAEELLDWLKKSPITLMLPTATYTFTAPEAKAPKAPCPVCYGTGFHKGFGAPCSKGCKAP